MKDVFVVTVAACACVAGGCSPGAQSEIAMDAELISGAKAAPVWQDLPGTSMRYLLSLPQDWQAGRTWPVIVVVTGSNSNFPAIAKGYQSARGEMPFIVAVPATISSGSQMNEQRYPHLPQEQIAEYAASPIARKLAYDVDGVQRTIADVQRRFGGERKVYLSGFSMGGTLAWHMALNRGDDFHIVFPVCCGFVRDADEIMPPGARAPAPDLPVFAFQGRQDHMRDGIEAEWKRASAFAAERGLTNVRRVVTWRSHDWHYEEILYMCYGHWLGRR
jgi:poly(3-hydroxybutyrate) depolymerase